MSKIDKVHNCFLTNKNNFDTGEQIDAEPYPVELTNNRTFSGIIISNFNWNGGRYVAVKPSEHRAIHLNSQLWTTILIEIELFGKHFKGFIVNFNDVTVKKKEVEYFPNSQIIDESKIVSIEYISNSEINHSGDTGDTNNQDNIIFLTNTFPRVYGRVVKPIRINCVDCVLVEYIHPPDENKREFSANKTDVKRISDFKKHILYYNSVIIEPTSILIIENITDEPKNLVRFEDSDGKKYQGKIVWTGKVNKVKAALIVLNENLWTDNIIPYIANKCLKQYVSLPDGQRAVCVPYFAIKDDLITYVTCSKTNLEVVDPNFKYLFETISENEKLITFKFKEELHVTILKWTGFIYNQKCIGCQLNCQSETGSNGTYGSQELFKCPPKTGVIITADKTNSDRITGLCEFGSHKDIEWRHTKFGFQVYNESSICCVENLDELEGMTCLKVGCKILYDTKFIGICKFIGKINGQPTVGVETEPNNIEDNTSFYDFFNFYALKNRKCNFINAKDISVGSFYTKYLPEDEFEDIASSIQSSDVDVNYYPGNNRKNKPIRGKIMWLGRHGNNNVCGIDLEKEYDDLSTNYFLEKGLFDSRSQHPVIDDIYKIEYIDKCNKTEMETCSSMKHCPPNIINCEELSKTIQLLLVNPLENISKIAERIIHYFPKDFGKYLHNNESMVPLNDIPIIFELLYQHGEFETIKQFIKNTKKINEIWPSLSTLFSLCIEDNKLDIVVDALDGLEIREDNDEANSICLQLAVKALEKISQSDTPEYDVLYQPLMEKCTNKTVYLTNSNEDIRETFLTTIIMDKSISESVVIEVLNSKQFDIDQQNSNKRSPLEIAIEVLKCNIVDTLFELGCKKKKIFESMKLLYDPKKGNPTDSKKIDAMLKILDNEMSRGSNQSANS